MSAYRDERKEAKIIDEDDGTQIFLACTSEAAMHIASAGSKRGTNPLGSMLAPFMYALNFLHCKNVNVEKNGIPEKLIKANIKRGGLRPYFEKYYTLGIEPMKKALRSEGAIQETGLRKAIPYL